MIIITLKMYSFAFLLALVALTQAMILARRPPSTNIVGGVDADVGEFPMQVMVWKNSANSGNGDQTCAGTLIDEYWVLSAAHCFLNNGNPPDVDNYYFWLGLHHKDPTMDTVDAGAQRVSAEIIIKHPNYNYDMNSNDVALIKLKQPANLSNPKIAPASIRRDDPPEGTMITVTGWGTQGLWQRYDYDLQKVDVPVISDDLCKFRYRNYQFTVDETMICAGDTNDGGEDACSGDSGGPMHWKDGGVSYVAGVVSWGNGCAEKRHPGVYARVSYFVDWIEQTTGLSLA